MPNEVTVLGVNGTVVALPFSTADQAAVAQSLANVINAGVLGGTLKPVNAVGINAPTLPAGTPGELVVQQSGLQILSPGYKAVVVKAYSVSMIGTGEQNQTVLAGQGGLSYLTNGGYGTVVAGGGTNDIITSSDSTHGWYVDTGNGKDTVESDSGNDTIHAGFGHNQVILGTGNNVVDTSGHDTIVAGSGAATIAVSSNATALIYGGSGQLLVLGEGSSSTIVGSSGSETLFGGGRGYYSGGSNGNNYLQGAGTLVAGGTGDSLFGVGYNDTLVAGPGADTLTGLGGNDLFEFLKTTGGGTSVVQGLNGSDSVTLAGYSSSEAGNAIANATVSGGNTTIKLSDNTTITFDGVTDPSKIHIS